MVEADERGPVRESLSALDPQSQVGTDPDAPDALVTSNPATCVRPDGGLLIGPSQVFTEDIPTANIVALFDAGEDQGVLEFGELLVNRNGRLVAKIVVRSVQKDRCIANVLPGWELGEVMEGDLVIPAHPAS